MTDVTVTLPRFAAGTMLTAVRFKLKKRRNDARRAPWTPERGDRDMTGEEIHRLEIAEREIIKALGWEDGMERSE